MQRQEAFAHMVQPYGEEQYSDEEASVQALMSRPSIAPLVRALRKTECTQVRLPTGDTRWVYFRYVVPTGRWVDDAHVRMVLAGSDTVEYPVVDVRLNGDTAGIMAVLVYILGAYAEPWRTVVANAEESVDGRTLVISHNALQAQGRATISLEFTCVKRRDEPRDWVTIFREFRNTTAVHGPVVASSMLGHARGRGAR